MKEDLQQEKGMEKFKSMVEEIRTCMFITGSTTGEHDHTRPMATADVEDDGTLWFFTDIRSLKVKELNEEQEVHLVYSHPGKESYLDVWGKGSIVKDKVIMKEKWIPPVKVFFPDGLEDPNLTLLKVKPNQVYYWDSGTNKMVSMVKMAAALVFGKEVADAKEGSISIDQKGA